MAAGKPERPGPHMGPSDMFRALTSQAPKMETRRALLVLNLQNDSFGVGDLEMTKTFDMAERAKGIVPAFRKLGEIVWVQTEFLTDEASRPNDGEYSSGKLGLGNYFPSSRDRARKRKLGNSGELVDVVIEPFEADDDGEPLDDYLARHQDGPPPLVFQPGTHGVQIKDDLQPFVDNTKDLVMVKHHHSAFDSTPLLMYLRMKFVTHIYLCGYLSNVSIYATAADAVRHGFEVSVVEDCLGYRSEQRHVDAMRKMADFLGVSGVDSDEINQEAAGGAAPPDADEHMFTGPGMEGITRSPGLSDGARPQKAADSAEEKSNKTARDSKSPEAAADVSSPRKRTMGSHGSEEPTDRSSPSGGATSPSAARRDKAKELDPDPNKTYGPDDRIGEGDSSILFDALSPDLSKHAFDLVNNESEWQVMHHLKGEVPRRVAVQGELGEHGSIPIYRHPADESPPLREFSKAVRTIRDELQILLKQPFNHVLIQLYRSGHDNISEHSDKTLDIVRGSSIVNLSLGAQRNMVLRTKKPPRNKRESGKTYLRQTQKIPMPHNSVFILGSRTNARWLHAVRPDKRLEAEKTDAEKAFGGARISLTFRHIGTFISADQRRIWGQGARSKWQATAGEISLTDGAEMEAMIIAFGNENQQSDFDWDSSYGRGFDVLNLVTARSTLYLGGDQLANIRVKMCVIHSGLDCKITKNRPDPSDSARRTAPGNSRRTIFALSGDDAPMLREVDPTMSDIVGDLAILFYLNKLYIPSEAEADDGSGSSATGAASGRGVGKQRAGGAPSWSAAAAAPAVAPRGRLKQLASNVYARITQANELLFLWQELRGRPLTASTRATHQVRRMSAGRSDPLMDATPLEAFEDELEVWEEYADETEFIAGDVYAIVDCAFWPVLDEIVRRWQGWSERRYPNLADYWKKVGALESTRRAFADVGDGPQDVQMRHA